jgi:hypothetical protein
MIFASMAQAVEIESVQASRAGQRYVVELVMTVDIPESYVRAILLDPDRVVKVNTELVGVQHLPSEVPGVRRFRDHTMACVWIFCVDYYNTLNMKQLDSGQIQILVEPEHSEFEYGKFVWQTHALGPDQSSLRFYSETIPGFWVPSLGLLRSRMQQGLQRMAIKMECEYRGDQLCAESEWVDSTSQ